jgi:E3 ubiquitin-protein ligase DOA10
MEKKKSSGRPSGTKDTAPRKMTMSKLQALAKAQAVRKANLERRRKQREGIQPIEPEVAEVESHDEIIEKIPDNRQYKNKEDSINTQKSQPIKKTRRKIVIVKEPESDSEESVEIKYIKPKTKSRKREVSYDDYDDYDDHQRPKREQNALDLLLKHYGGF